ncbi:MAG: DNA mismatch repair protein MutS [Acidobacteria bacterium]|nr:MAG: DNA mismatch repair protein MutS [Acidobacteriota bacterium]
MMPAVRPRDLYAQRLIERRDAAAALRKRELTISFVRVAVAVIAVILLFVRAWLALIPVALFIALAIVHERIIRARKRLESGAAFYERGIARIDGTWAGRGDRGDEFADDHHPYAADFDLFGNASLFELISLAVTRSGRTRLANWLKSPSMDVSEIRARQSAVSELRENVDLREDLATDAVTVTLDEWASMPRIEITPMERVASIVLPLIAMPIVVLTIPALFALWSFPIWPLIAISAVIGVVTRTMKPRVEQIIAGIERAEPALALLAGMLERLERERFACERLTQLQSRIDHAHVEIERLRKRVALLDARRNQFFMPIAALLMWTPNVAFAIERWRAEHGRSVIDWIDVVAEFEALASLASFAFEHPSFAMPEVTERAPLFDAHELGHPLIPDDRRISNDLRLDDTLRLLIVSGSNMSGKSTMLRSAGIAAVLAMSGAPVCAKSLTISPMAVGASIRIHDSLQENASRFYAEILRIRQVLEMSQRGPLLFLLDEMLAGTNSHDRRIGADAIVRALVERGAVGLVSTHDLALAQIADELAPKAANVHFEDHLEHGNVVFDYRMRPGVVTKSNALALMRSVGIDV